MNARIHHHPVFALVFLAVGLLDSPAGEPANEGPPTPETLSTPQSGTVSSNLNQINAKKSALTDLESGLKKPFEIFGNGRGSGDLTPASTDLRYVPPAPVLNNKKLKELLNKRAETKYLLPEDDENGLKSEVMLLPGENALDPSGKRSKSPMDLYYDRIDRERLGPTNGTTRSSLEFFGNKQGPEEKDDAPPKKSGWLFDSEISASARALGQMSNSSFGGGFLSSEKSKPRSFGEIFGTGGSPEKSPSKDAARDTRLDEFKRLIDGPGFGSRNEFNVTPPPSSGNPDPATRPVLGVISPSWSTPAQSVPGGSFGNAPGLAGAIGTPMGVPDYANGTPSLTPTAPLQKPTPRPPPPTFNVPRRRF